MKALALILGFVLSHSSFAQISTPLDVPKTSEIDYRIGNEWGKHIPTESEMNNPIIKRAVQATGRIHGATGFFLGKFNDHFLVATNHHVCPSAHDCVGYSMVFPYLSTSFFKVNYFLGHWPEIDLALIGIKISNKDDFNKLMAFAQNFSFNEHPYQGQELLTTGYGRTSNPTRKQVLNMDSDCKVFSATKEYVLMSDPDEENPSDYKAWSFAHGCDISHGDSGSAMLDRKTGKIIGITWTGRVPKSPAIQDSTNLGLIFKNQSFEIWKELSYAVSAKKIKEILELQVQKDLTLQKSNKDNVQTLQQFLGL